MAKKINEALVKTGMDRDSHPSNIQNNTTYTHAKNANIENENGEFLVLKNEKSNILASKFKEGFKVIHAVNDIDTTNTYFFLVNPTTGVGEFGIIENNQSVPNLEDTLVACGDCNYYNELSEPLEQLAQVALQTYTTLLSDACTTPVNGFNFNILNPIKTSIIKNEKTGKTIYFSHKGNPPRYINVDRISDYFIKEEPCADDTILTCPDFDKMRVFKLFSIPKLIPNSIEVGGNLKMGVYEFLVAYCNSEGQEISEYYSISTPIAIFDENNQIQGQPNTTDRTNLSIRLNVEGLDTKYTHYKVAVIQTADIKNATRYFVEGIHTINDTSILYVTEQNKKETSIDALTRNYLFVEEAEGVATANNVLYQYGITNKKELNLQPIVNLLGDLTVKWQSHIAPEDLYKNGVNTAKYLGYQRDEIVPLGIKFLLRGGYETAVFPFIGRSPNEFDLEELVDEEGVNIDTNNKDVESIVKNIKSCNNVNRRYNWQYYNTATKDEGTCPNGEEVETVLVPTTSEKVCTIEQVNTIPANTFDITVDEGETFIDLLTYINDNKGTTEVNCNLELPSYICDALYDTYPDDVCNPNNEDFCTPFGTPTVNIKVGAIEGEQRTYVEKNISDYLATNPPSNCFANVREDASAGFKQNIEIKDLYNLCGSTLYIRDFQIYNEVCSYAEDIFQKPDLLPGVPPSPTLGLFHNYYFEKKFNNLLKPTVGGAVPLVNQIEQYFYVTHSVGATGDLVVKILGNTYTTAFTSNNAITIASFLVTHKTAIDAQTGGTLTISGSRLKLAGATICYIDEVYTNVTSGELEEVYEIVGEFAKFLHKNTLFYKGQVNNNDKVILDISKKGACTNSDYVANANLLRYTVYDNCSLNNIIYEGIVDVTQGLLKEIDATLLSGNTFILALDTPLREFNYQDQVCGTCDNNPISPLPDCKHSYAHYTSTLCGCFSLFTRKVEYEKITVSWDNIYIEKQMTFNYNCIFEYPVVKSCKAFPYEKGDFAFWQSEETYPDNNELYNSSNLLIKGTDIPINVKEKFEEIYADLDINGVYQWKEGGEGKKNADFTCRNIRHFKFPDNAVSPFMFENILQPFTNSTIYPLGVTLDEEVLNSFLDIAKNNNLISLKERESIVGYEIVRGDISFDRSVIASGLAYDMRDYKEKSDTLYYSNYPYNSYSADKMNNTTNPYIGIYNSNYTFHSPDTDYFRPSLPTEMTVQGYMFGKSKGYFDEVEGHPKWVILSPKARNLANNLAILEAATEATIATMNQFSNYEQQVGFSSTVFSGAFVSMIVTGVLGGVTSAVFKIGRYRYEWLKVFQDLGTPHNFAYYYYSEGNYNYFKTLQVQNQRLRALNIGKYLNMGISDYTNEVTGKKLTINNVQREKSAFLSTGDFPITYPSTYAIFDKESITFQGENGVETVGKSPAIYKNIASPYISLKNYLPSQYSTLNSISWISTGYRGDLENPNNTCLSIFGGDTFISRHTVKRKHAQFLTNSMQQADRTPFNYFFYNNIGRNPLFYVSYNVNKDFDTGGRIFPNIDNDFNMDNLKSNNSNYYTPPSKFYLYYYGVPSFLCETRINTNYRYAEIPLQRQFFPQVGDLGSWTQEKNVSIREPEYFFYNKAYSKQVTRLKNRTLADNYNKELNDVRTDFPNGILSSLPDNSENNTYDPWLIYRPLDFFEFPTNFGKLKHVQGIENEAIFVRFENTSILYNKVDYTNDDGQSPTRPFLGGTSAFQRRSSSFYNAQLGFGGSQNTTSVSCEFGHFHVDAKRGQVIQTQPSGQQMEEISAMIGGKPSGMRAWFKEHLPFKILKHFKDVDVDNNYNGVGITMAWDSRYRRVFITKKDYIPTNPAITHLNGKYFLGETEVFLTDNTKFLDVSWTIAFSPILGAWMSFYDFKPNYYVSHNEYFQSGVNDTGSKFGLWSHGLTNKSFGVFYGDKYSFDVEYIVKNEYMTKRLDSVSLFTEAKRYHNEYDWSFNPDLTFNKSLIHNNVACSGYLNLIPQRNNFFNNKNYPKTNTDDTQDILISNKDNFQWNYNYFYNRVQNNVSNIPFINYDKNQIEKSINSNIVGFKGKRVLDRISGDYFKNLLKYDTDSRFSLGLKFTLNEVDI